MKATVRTVKTTYWKANQTGEYPPLWDGKPQFESEILFFKNSPDIAWTSESKPFVPSGISSFARSWRLIYFFRRGMDLQQNDFQVKFKYSHKFLSWCAETIKSGTLIWFITKKCWFRAWNELVGSTTWQAVGTTIFNTSIFYWMKIWAWRTASTVGWYFHLDPGQEVGTWTISRLIAHRQHIVVCH